MCVWGVCVAGGYDLGVISLKLVNKLSFIQWLQECYVLVKIHNSFYVPV